MTNKENAEHIVYARLTDKGLDVLQSHMDRTGLGKSAAVRMIINEWKELKDERMHLLSNQLDRRDPYWKTEKGVEQSR